MATLDLSTYRDRIVNYQPLRAHGKILDIVGLTLRATGPNMHLGDLCYVQSRRTNEKVPVEVVGFREERILLMPLGDMHGIGPGDTLIPTFAPRMLQVGPALLGRVLDGSGRPIDNGPPLQWEREVPVIAPPPSPMGRERIMEPLATGIRAIDSCITCGRGQRVGIMSGSGVGKSKLLGMVARNTDAAINVIALVGERGREVREFLEKDLGPEGLAKSVVVVATSDEPALQRIHGANVATSIAEYFRDQGQHVLLMMDSITRFAMAQREVGLAVGEPPTTKGYPPSVYAMLPKLLERAGTGEQGSITGMYTVLVEADDLNDPVGDAVRSILDGHISLSRDLASKNHYPPVDVLESISRNMLDVTTEAHQTLAGQIRNCLAVYREAEDLVNIGAYVSGSNAEIDMVLRLMPNIRAFLQQGLYELTPFDKVEMLMDAALKG